MQAIPENDEAFFGRSNVILAREGVDPNSQAAMPLVLEELGFLPKTRLLNIFARHSLIRIPAFANSPAALLAVGDNATEAWASNVLVLLVEAKRLDSLKRCAKPQCHQWFIARRPSADKYHSTSCRVADYQSDEEFKATRAQEERERYKNEKDGKVVRGWRRREGTQPNAKAAK